MLVSAPLLDECAVTVEESILLHKTTHLFQTTDTQVPRKAVQRQEVV